MIYKIKEHKNILISKVHKEGMKEFNKFFGINWIHNIPNICLLNNRKEIDLFWYKSPRWVIGFARNNIIFLLESKNFEKESSHKKRSNEEYSALIKHELCHLFYGVHSQYYHKPKWLTEGVSIYLSGQMKYKKQINKFLYFIDAYEKDVKKGAYDEGGMAVKILVENFGKKKLLKLISQTKGANDKRKFAKLFKEIYNFDLNYKNFNNLLNKR